MIPIGMETLKFILMFFNVILMMGEGLAASVGTQKFEFGGSNMRHLVCVNKKTGERGICMFAFTCILSNGTHLGACIDRFYFGTCCKLEDQQTSTSYFEEQTDQTTTTPTETYSQTENRHDEVSEPNTSTRDDTRFPSTDITENSIKNSVIPYATTSFSSVETIFTEFATDTEANANETKQESPATADELSLLNDSYLSTVEYTTEILDTTSMNSYTSTISGEIPSETTSQSISNADGETAMESTRYPGSPTTTDTIIENDSFLSESIEPSWIFPPWMQVANVKKQASEASHSTKATESGSHFLLGVNASDYTEVCGRRLLTKSRIVGGEKSGFGKWPWQVSLRVWNVSNYRHKCGAALLNENWAITAAHCLLHTSLTDLVLRFGEFDFSKDNEPYDIEERRLELVITHPQFDLRTFEYDLALLRFRDPVRFQPNIIPICLPEDEANFVGQTAYVTGWGRLYKSGPLPDILQEVSVPVINNFLCENMYRSVGYAERIPKIFICAGRRTGGIDACEGDSGGPMAIQREDKRWILAGVISWGIGCGEPNRPGVYTRISKFRTWIQYHLNY